MSHLPAASLIIGSYEDSAILAKSLAALAAQSFTDFEIVIADDGSRTDYSPILRLWACRFAYGIQHVTHEKNGFRKARILNRGIHVSHSDRLIFLDMDCLPHRDFVRNHLRYLTRGLVITGRRVHVQRDAVPDAESILKNGLRFGIPKLLSLWLRKKARVIEHGFVSPILYESSFSGILGSNFSLFKADIAAVNGFNEEFVGWGGEETELEVRLRRNGCNVRNLRNKVVQYHLMHPQRSMEDQSNTESLEQTRRDHTVRARVGLTEIREGDYTVRHYTG